MDRTDRPERAPAKCPQCGRRKGAEISYGYPAPDAWPEIEKLIGEGRTVLGGCCIGEEDPQYRCTSCGHEWGKAEH